MILAFSCFFAGVISGAFISVIGAGIISILMFVTMVFVYDEVFLGLVCLVLYQVGFCLPLALPNRVG